MQLVFYIGLAADSTLQSSLLQICSVKPLRNMHTMATVHLFRIMSYSQLFRYTVYWENCLGVRFLTPCAKKTSFIVILSFQNVALQFRQNVLASTQSDITIVHSSTYIYILRFYFNINGIFCISAAVILRAAITPGRRLLLGQEMLPAVGNKATVRTSTQQFCVQVVARPTP